MESFLILDADSALRERLSHYFGAQGFYIDVAPDSASLWQRLEQHIFDVVIFDVDAFNAPPENLLHVVRENNVNTVVIAMCERAKFDEAIRAIREGATDFILKPINLAELEIKVDKGIELKRLNQEGQALRGERALIYKTKNFIGHSPRIRKVLTVVEKVAKSSSSVILVGETGTGKELLAGAIHYSSPRSRNAFVRVNCATLPDTLLESELFGHERGAFTGAEKMRIGRFEQANGGSVFLDEIADVTLPTQAKLLRVLQEHEFERLGSNRTIKVDVRIISATNKDLENEIEEGRFREDLYYRLNVVTIKIPPLREREGDVELLSEFFLHKFAQTLNKKIRKIDTAAMRLLKGYHWPGNIRELENTMERAVLMADTETITPDDLSLPFKPEHRLNKNALRIPVGGLKWEEMEKDLLIQALSMSGWVQKEAAKFLGLSTRVLNYKVKHFGITHPSWKQNR
ncbi:MAG: sigma-54-dependent transcriptional regulator [Spirochaetia bacterium]